MVALGVTSEPKKKKGSISLEMATNLDLLEKMELIDQKFSFIFGKEHQIWVEGIVRVLHHYP